MNDQKYHEVDNPRFRIPTIDAGRLSHNKTSMIGFLEVDITHLREKLREFRKQNENFSFTASMIKILADCVAANRHVQAALVNDRKLMQFDDVDISISIERKLKDFYFPFPLIIRSANRKNVLEIDQEIKNVTDKQIVNEYDLFLPDKPALSKFFINFFYVLPSWFRVLAMQTIVNNPLRAKQTMGTVGFATVTMTGRLSGWVFPSKNPYSLYVALGSVTRKPLVVKDKVRIREVLNMSAIFNHNVIDGTPARSFMSDLVDRITNGRIEIA